MLQAELAGILSETASLTVYDLGDELLVPQGGLPFMPAMLLLLAKSVRSLKLTLRMGRLRAMGMAALLCMANGDIGVAPMLTPP